jgi:hypothetical protein
LGLATSAEVASAQVQDPGQPLGVGTFPLQPANGLIISFTNNDPILTIGDAERIAGVFIEAYPQECAAFSYSNCTNEVSLIVELGFDVPCGENTRAYACTRGPEITIATEYLRSNREDYDLITHEAMHVVQDGGPSNNYRAGEACWYWNEGIADVARDAFGTNNDAAGWVLTPGDYTNGYREAAHFLRWVEAAYGSQVLVYLDKWMREEGCPTDTFWIAQTSVGLTHLLTAYDSAVRGG